MFKVLQAHEEVDPKAVLKTQSKRAQKRLARREKARELESKGYTQEQASNDTQSKCTSAPIMDLDYDTALSHYEEVYQQNPAGWEQMLEEIMSQLQRTHLHGAGAAEDGHSVDRPEPGRRAGGTADGCGSSFASDQMLASGRSMGAQVDCPPGPGPGCGLARWQSAETSWPPGTSHWTPGRSGSLPLTAAALQRMFRVSTSGGGAGGDSAAAAALASSPMQPGKLGARSPQAPSLGDRGAFPALAPAASSAAATHGWTDQASAGHPDGSGSGWDGSSNSSSQGGGGVRTGAAGTSACGVKGARAGKHGRGPVGGIKVLNKAQPHLVHHHHQHHNGHHSHGHQQQQQHAGGRGRGSLQHHPSAPGASGPSGTECDTDGGPGVIGSHLNLALLWELLEGGLLLREDPLGEDGGEGLAAPDPDPDGRAVIRRMVQAQCEHGGDGPARGVSQEEMIEMMTRAHRRQRRRVGTPGSGSGQGRAAASPAVAVAAVSGGIVGGGGSSGSDDEAHLYQDKDDSKSWRRTMDWMVRNDWVRMPDTGKHYKFRRMLPNGQLQVQTVCCTPSDAMRGIRNLQAELARKDAAANEVIRSWRLEQRKQRKAAAEAAAAAAAAAEEGL